MITEQRNEWSKGIVYPYSSVYYKATAPLTWVAHFLLFCSVFPSCCVVSALLLLQSYVHTIPKLIVQVFIRLIASRKFRRKTTLSQGQKDLLFPSLPYLVDHFEGNSTSPWSLSAWVQSNALIEIECKHSIERCLIYSFKMQFARNIYLRMFMHSLVQAKLLGTRNHMRRIMEYFLSSLARCLRQEILE